MYSRKSLIATSISLMITLITYTLPKMSFRWWSQTLDASFTAPMNSLFNKVMQLTVYISLMWVSLTCTAKVNGKEKLTILKSWH